MTVLLLIFLALTALILEAVVIRRGPEKLRYRVRLSQRAVDCGEPFVITTTLENDKLLPVMFLRVSETVPVALKVDLARSGASFHIASTVSNTRSGRITQSMYLLGRQRVSRRLSASLPARGRYFFNGATLTTGDLLGIRETSREYTALEEIVVYPRRTSAPEITRAFGNYLGEMSVRRFIHEDPVLTQGFREYSGREPMKSIAWPRSLREGKLMVKQLDYTLELTATVILNVDCPRGAVDYTAVERCFSLTRTVCEELEGRQISYEFITNAAAAGASGNWASLGSGLGSQHLMSILEGLGRATYHATCDLAALLARAARSAEQGRCHVLVTPGIDAAGRATLARAEDMIGSAVFLIDGSAAEETGEEAAG